MKAGVASQDGIPVLNFLFIVDRIGTFWAARSVLTGHVAESATSEGAVENLTRAIDVAIEVAGQQGHPAELWYAAQRPAESQYLERFVSAMTCPKVLHRREQAPSGRVVIDAQVLGAA